MVSTGRVKFSSVILSMAEAAEALNHCRPKLVLANMAMSTTPETYSGVAVLVMEKIDRPRSSREPSRMPASTPTISAIGTMTTMTQSISQPVSATRSAMMPPTGWWNTVEKPK